MRKFRAALLLAPAIMAGGASAQPFFGPGLIAFAAPPAVRAQRRCKVVCIAWALDQWGQRTVCALTKRVCE